MNRLAQYRSIEKAATATAASILTKKIVNLGGRKVTIVGGEMANVFLHNRSTFATLKRNPEHLRLLPQIQSLDLPSNPAYSPVGT